MRALFVAAALALSACVHHGEPAFQRPDVVRFGANVADTEAALDGLCPQRRTRPIDPPFLSNVRDRQMQIDCDGFRFMGQGRHVEFVFRDDAMVMVWLMVTPAETDAVIAAMTEAYGAPSDRNQGYVAFSPHRAAWRFEPAEILFYAPSEDADMRAYFN